jgi:uncharacterized protein (TIGR00255 family)
VISDNKASSPLRSMTGFARSRKTLDNGEIIVSVKSLNHRGLDVQVHAPSAADEFENAIRSMVKARLLRGHVEVRISLPSSAANGSSALALNRDLLHQYLKAFREAAEAHNIHAEPDLNAAFRHAGMLAEAAPEAASNGVVEKEVLEALAEALDGLNEFRAREGAEISAEMRANNNRVFALAAEMEQIRSTAHAAFHSRLSEKLRELLKGVQIDPQRLAQEAAILADRSDIGEELARLKIHSAQLTGMLDTGGEIGKKLDFLLQEMNRETNTILSKTSGAGEAGLKITDLALGAKASIEKVREQSLNLE